MPRAGFPRARLLCGLALVALASACTPSCGRNTDQGPAEKGAATSADAADGAVRARDGAHDTAQADPPFPLVVSIVIDQLGSDTLLHLLPLLHEDGFIRHTLAQGVFFERARLAYAATLTGPGHASLHTGVVPQTHGIAANFRWHDEKKHAVSFFDDDVHPVHGAPGVFASPAALKTQTVGTFLKAQNAKSKSVAVSIKSRAAIPSAGHDADGVYWYESSIPGFTTSSFYAPSMPFWLQRWQAAHPIAADVRPWTPLRSYADVLGPDRQRGEGGEMGFGAVFPHDIRRAKQPFAAWKATPDSTLALIALAKKVVQHESLGQDAHPDLLVLSVSGTDVAGHLFGPHSWEYTDHLIRADMALGEFVRWLRTRGRVAALLTSDHGVAPLPERKLSPEAMRVDAGEVRRVVALAVEKVAGPGEWVRGVMGPHLLLSPAARAHENYAAMVEAAAHALAQVKGIAAAYPIVDPKQAVARTEGKDGKRLDDRYLQAVRYSTPSTRFADVYVVPEEYAVLGPPRGTSHGAPWAYDAEVPVLIAADAVVTKGANAEGPKENEVDTPGDQPKRAGHEADTQAPRPEVADGHGTHITRPVDQTSVAPTLCKLLGLPPGPEMMSEALAW